MTMLEFSVDEWTNISDESEDDWATGQLRIAIEDDVLTRVEDLHSRSMRDHIRVSVAPLARWLLSNYWRIMFEPLPATDSMPSIDWSLAHSMSSVGGEYVWPHLTFVTNGKILELTGDNGPRDQSRPISFTNLNDRRFVTLESFSEAVDGLLQQTVERVAALHDSDLCRLWNEFLEERQDPEIVFYREIEARLGFQPGDAPRHIVLGWGNLVEEFSERAIEEVVAAHKDLDAAKAVAEHAKASTARLYPECLNDIRKTSIDQTSQFTGPAYLVANQLAAKVRDVLGIDGPFEDADFQDRFGLDAAASHEESSQDFAASWTREDSLSFVHRSRNAVGRRFELGRIVGDWLGFEQSRLRPSLDAKTWRQQFQKSFSQALLAPLNVIESMLPSGSSWDDDAIRDVAESLQVSEMTVWSTLRNNHVIARDFNS